MVDNNLDKYTIIVEEQDNYTIELNEQGPQGLRGIQGEVGPTGPQGEAATIVVGSTTTSEPGTEANVVNSGDENMAILEFTIPKGEKGDKGDTGVSVVGVEEISKVGLVATYRMTFSNGEYFDYEVADGSIDGLTREEIINIIGYEPASYTSVEGLTTRVATLEERVEDLTASKFPNVVIIGSPHIEGGQVNDFSDTNYLQFPFVDISRGLPFDIYFSFTTGSDVVSQQNILDSYFGIALAIQNSKGIMALSSNGTSWDIGNVTGTNTILPNTTYYAKCSWTGTQYNASLSTNDTTYVPDMVLNNTLITNKTTIFIGGSPDLFGVDSSHPFKGTINFNNSRVDVQGTTVWEGMADVGLASRANVSLNNLDEVGEKRFTDIQIALDGKQDKGTSGSGLEICDIGMALYVDETKGLRRYLNGQIIDINTNTQAFLDRLKEIQTTNPEHFTTEDNWQAEALLNIDGCVYKFVLNYADDGETVVSVRLPKYPDYVEINAGGTLPVVGNGISLGITDGTNNYSIVQNSNTYGLNNSNGYGRPVGSSGTTQLGGTVKTLGVTTNPTKSGIQTTLKQTKLKMRYFIQIATGSETEANIVNTLENVNAFTLLESKYSDKPLYNESWLLSNGQWNAKSVYPTAYEGLQVEYNSEIEAGTTVTLPSGVSYTKRGLSVKLSTEEYTDYDFRLNTAEETFRLPLKTKLASGKAVVGNGMTLGFTNGSLEGGIVNNSGGANIFEANLPTPVGSAVGNVIQPYAKTFGITTYPTKSGIETSDSDLYLYFYVGDIDQNHGIVNMGRIGEQLANKVDTSNTQWATNACMPDYSAGISVTEAQLKSGYTFPYTGVLIVSAEPASNGTVKINDLNFTQHYVTGTCATPIEHHGKEGTKITYSSFYKFYQAYYFPLVGVK